MDLHISQRLKDLLPALSKEERQQLKANIEEDGEVTDVIQFWNDGKQNVVMDGMNRWELIRGKDIPYTTKELFFDSYEDAELWILNHQLGRRNLMDPKEVRTLRGKMYNKLKRKDGGHGDQKSEGQNDPPILNSAQIVAEKAGVSEKTVKRDGARVDAIDGMTKAAKVIASKASDSEVKALAKLDPGQQDVVARAVRTGQAATVKEAMSQAGVKPKSPPKSSKGKEKASAASLVDSLVKKHVGQIARGLTTIAEANGGEGEQFKLADGGLNQLINALREMRKGKR